MPLKNVPTECLLVFKQAVFLGLLNAHFTPTIMVKHFIPLIEILQKLIFKSECIERVVETLPNFTES